MRGTREGNVLSWKGIPYAAPPAGKLRFRHAVPVEPWDGILEADEFGDSCPQVPGRSSRVGMSEDCLRLSVWAAESSRTDRPVLVFLHGGSFCKGSTAEPDLDGTKLSAAGDAVIVTLNYRLGALGFLDFSDFNPEFQANCGVSDVAEALRWIQKNIHAFGGDPHNVTLSGQSAGAIMTSMLPAMPDLEGLVQRAILMSAGPTLPFTKETARDVSRKFAQFMQVDAGELATMNALTLTARQAEFARACGLGAGTFMPEIDGTLIRDYPIAAASRGDAVPVPLLVGTTREEMSFFFVKPVADYLDIRGIMDAGVDAEPEHVRSQIAGGYDRYGKRGPAVMISDLVFRMGSVWLAEAMSRLTDVWMYRFDFETFAMRISRLHAFHSSDIPFVFGNHSEGLAPLMFLFSPSKKRIRELTAEMQKDFLQFASEGSLPWPRCSGEDTPAKCYGRKTSTVQQAVDPDIKQRYTSSNFYRRSFRGESNNLHP